MFREHLRKIDNRQWWLWSSTVLVLILLTLAVASFAFPAILKEDSTSSFYLNQAVRALVGIVLCSAFIWCISKRYSSACATRSRIK